MKKILLALMATLTLGGCATAATAHSALPAFSHCGYERWPVKTGTDASVNQVNLSAIVPQTIAGLDQITAPSVLPQVARVSPVETTVYQVKATLEQYKMESDSDYHLVLSDGQGDTMIAEIPSPSCVDPSSPFYADISQARAAFDARYTPGDFFQSANVPVTVTGVGFFDFLHGQSGVAPNGIEFHPVLNIQFGS